MDVIPHLNFGGQCETAMKFYAGLLGGKITFMMKIGEMPGQEQAPEAIRSLVAHSTLTVDGQTIHGADAPPDRYEKPQGFSISLNLKDPAEADRVFRAFAEGGTVQMPLQGTFWAVRFGMVRDRFGTPWMINCERGAV